MMRSKNANEVRYDVQVRSDGELAEEPVVAYRVMKAEDGRRAQGPLQRSGRARPGPATRARRTPGMSLILLALLEQDLLARRVPRTHGGVVGQPWRGGAGRQARLTKLLPAPNVVSVDKAPGRRAGVLPGRVRKADVIGAAVVLVACDGDVVHSSDPRDLKPLADAAGVHVDVVPV